MWHYNLCEPSADIISCLNPVADEILGRVNKREESMKNSLTLQCTWHPEYASYMIEGTPSNAFGGYGEDLVRVEENMRMRRARINQALQKDEAPIETQPYFASSLLVF